MNQDAAEEQVRVQEAASGAGWRQRAGWMKASLGDQVTWLHASLCAFPCCALYVFSR